VPEYEEPLDSKPHPRWKPRLKTL